MANKLTATVDVDIAASSARVWKALTDPAEIKQWMFGTNASSTWQKGASLTYAGEWEGKHYTDKGTIIDIEPGKLLHTTYYSSMSGKEDKPENYANVIYTLTEEDDKTKLTITQDNIDTEEAKQHSISNWQMVLQTLKELAEKQ